VLHGGSLRGSDLAFTGNCSVNSLRSRFTVQSYDLLVAHHHITSPSVTVHGNVRAMNAGGRTIGSSQGGNRRLRRWKNRPASHEFKSFRQDSVESIPQSNRDPDPTAKHERCSSSFASGVMLLEILTGKAAVEVTSNGQQANLARLVSLGSELMETKGTKRKRRENGNEKSDLGRH
jgi:hypothetical protein